jgi:hypothetical protein
VVRQVLEERAAAGPVPPDWCYVHNFAEPHRPKALSLPAGRGKEFRRAIHDLIDELRSAIPAAFESDDFRIRKQAIEEAAKKRQEDAFNELNEAAQGRGIAVLRSPVGMMLAPVRDGQVIPPDEFRPLPQAEQERIRADIEELQKRLEKILQQIPQWEREVRTQLRQLGQDVTTSAVRHLIDELRGAYQDLPAVLEHLGAIERDLIETADQFVGGPAPHAAEDGAAPARDVDRFRRYWVNLLVDHGESRGAPVVYEDHPAFQNWSAGSNTSRNSVRWSPIST